MSPIFFLSMFCSATSQTAMIFFYFTNNVQGYLKALGRARTAEIQRDARIGEVEAKKVSSIKKCQADEELLAAKFANDTLVARAGRDFQMKKAAYDQEVQAKVWFHHYLVMMLYH